MAYKPLSPLDTRRQDRWRGMAFARIQSGPHAGRCISVVEFSETGCRVRDHEMICEPGEYFHLLLEDVGPVVAEVRWHRGAFYGLRFRNPLTSIVLEHLHEVVKQPLAERMARLLA